MDAGIIKWIVFFFVVIGLRFFLKKKKGNRRNYSLGLESAEEVQALIKNQTYDKAEEIVSNQSLNDITQIIDHLALSLEEQELLAWDEAQPSDLSKLTLGVYYLHMAWITRSHKFAKSVSTKQAQGFFEYLEQCEVVFEAISHESIYWPEVESRSIRLYMSLSEGQLAQDYFHRVSKEYPDLLWPYIHYAEMIQPKWGGAIEGVEEFYESLPDNLLIRSIVELKLILDSMRMEENYFEKYANDINEFARTRLVEIDAALDSNSIDSIHKYILYNYMEGISSLLELKELRAKYKTLMGSNYTIYPYGLVI